MALSGIRFQPDRDLTFSVLTRVCDQFISNEPKRACGTDRHPDFNAFNDDVPSSVCSQRQHRGKVATKVLEKLLECDGLSGTEHAQAPVHLADHDNAIGCRGQLRRLPLVRCRLALQRQQTYNHLLIIQESMIGLAAQERLGLDCVVLLTKQAFMKSDNLSQLEFSLTISFEFALVACDRAMLRGFNWSNQSYGWARGMLHGVALVWPVINSANKIIKCRNFAATSRLESV